MSVAETTKIKVNVSGIDCPSCGESVCRIVKKLDGVVEADFNIMQSSLSVTAANDGVSVSSVLNEIRKAGYSATEAGEAKKSDDSESPDKAAEARVERLEKAATVISGLFLAAANLSHYAFKLNDSITHSLFYLSILAGVLILAPSALKGLKKREIDMNVLMLVSVTGAVAIGELHEAAMVVFLFAVAHMLEEFSMDRARRAISSILAIAPPMALLKDGDDEREVKVEEVRVGDTVIIKPGDRIPLDGVVSSGATYVNQAAITGESLPVEKNVGDEVFAGTINERGSVEVMVTKLAADTTLAKIIHMIEEAQAGKAPSQKTIDKFARYYTPIVIVAAALIMTVPYLFFGQPFELWFYRALVMLVISCPCALVISTPVALVSALSRAAKAGVLIKGGVHLETIAKVKAVAFDKTGTLTYGEPVVVDVITANGYSETDVVKAAASINCRSEHHIGKAIREKAKEMKIEYRAAENFEALAGKGASGVVDGSSCFVGNHKMLKQVGYCEGDVCRTLEKLEAEGRTVIVSGKPKDPYGFIIIEDRVRETAGEAVEKLRSEGVKNIVMLTGDNRWTAERIASKMNIDEVESELLPGDKLDAVNRLLEKHGSVAMIGDGVNDAPALAASTVGIAMGTAGTDAAMETADIALMSDDLMKIPSTVRLGRSTISIIKQNIIFAVGLKAVFMVAAASGIATLWMAVFADTGASILVILNSLRLMKFSYDD